MADSFSPGLRVGYRQLIVQFMTGYASWDGESTRVVEASEGHKTFILGKTVVRGR